MNSSSTESSNQLVGALAIVAGLVTLGLGSLLLAYLDKGVAGSALTVAGTALGALATALNAPSGIAKVLQAAKDPSPSPTPQNGTHA